MDFASAARPLPLHIRIDGWRFVNALRGRQLLESALLSWLPRQRWFASKSRPLQSVSILDYAILTASIPSPFRWAIFFIAIADEVAVEHYQLPLALLDASNAGALTAISPQGLVTTIATDDGDWLVLDATGVEDFRQSFLGLIEGELAIDLAGSSGQITGSASRLLSPRPRQLASFVHSGEQSNTNIVFADTLILKLFRKLQPGINPDIEITRFLTEVGNFPHIPTFLGEISLTRNSEESTSTAMLQEMVKNQGDGWNWTLAHLSRFFAVAAEGPPPDDAPEPPTFLHQPRTPQPILDHAGSYLDAAALLGRRTAELHLALATTTTNEAFQSEPLTATDLQREAFGLSDSFAAAFDHLSASGDEARALLARRPAIAGLVQSLTASNPSGQRIRIHGDYHLGQVLRANDDFVILDFEGEPARSLHDRRRKQSPLKDVAGMLRSFAYAAGAALKVYADHPPELLKTWARLWQNAVSSEFLRSYIATASQNHNLLPEPELANLVLRTYLIDKALYELQYELNNRPTWVSIPLSGLITLTEPGP